MNYIELIIDLLKCAITDKTPEIDHEGIDAEELFKIAESHKIANILYVPLKNAGIDMSAEGWNKFQTAYDIGVMLSYQQEYYLETVSAILKDNKIWFMPLKGSIIKYLYPTPDMRQSSDIDILFDETKAELVKSLLEKEGFINTAFGSDQDVYKNNNVMIEMHRSLLPERSPLFEGVKSIIKRAATDDGYHYIMTDEDFYVFDIIHIAKHVSEGGIGIRAVLDIWVYLRHYQDKLDWDAVNERLEELKLSEFEKHLKCVCLYWFEDGPKDSVSDELINYIVKSGWTGTYEQKYALISEDYATGNKFIYYIKYFFKKPSEIKIKYKYLDKYPWLVPIAWGDRIFNALFVRKNAIKNFIHRYDNITNDDIHELKDFVKRIGL